MQSRVARGNTLMLPRNTRNSEMKPAIPGRPALAITPRIIKVPVKGKPRSGLSRPRNTSRSRVPVLRYTMPTNKKSRAEIRPWLTIWNTAPSRLTGVAAAAANRIMPM